MPPLSWWPKAPRPLSYQWLLNESILSGANQASLTVSNAAFAQNGNLYRVIVSNVSRISGHPPRRSSRLSTLRRRVIACPANIVASTDPGQCARSNVTYAAAATDNCSGATVACVPPTGSTFPKGLTMVSCRRQMLRATQ